MFNFDYHNPNDNWGYDPYKGMNDDERVSAGCMSGLAYIIAMAIGVLICSLFSSCTTTQYVPVIEHKTDTVRQCLTLRDSVWVHDSTFIKEKGDTVRIERWHTKFIEKVSHDTTYVATHDTIPQPYPVTEYVEKPLGWWQKGLIWIGIIALMVVIVTVVWKMKRFLPIR